MSYINDVIGTIVQDGKIKVLSKTINKIRYVDCECLIHGTKFDIDVYALKRNGTNCRQCQKLNRLDGKQYLSEIIGTVIQEGRTEVLHLSKLNKYSVHCKCIIHNIEFDIPYSNLKKDMNGCHKCQTDKNSKNGTKHGLNHTKTYRSFISMVRRITNKNSADYNRYGGRGIDMDPRYDPQFNNQGIEISLLNFIDDLKELNLYPIPEKLTLERIDVNKGYWKDNITLATYQEQNQNKRNSVFTPDIIREARQLYSTGNYTYAELGRKYKVDTVTIRKAIIGETWDNII